MALNKCFKSPVTNRIYSKQLTCFCILLLIENGKEEELICN